MERLIATCTHEFHLSASDFEQNTHFKHEIADKVLTLDGDDLKVTVTEKVTSFVINYESVSENPFVLQMIDIESQKVVCKYSSASRTLTFSSNIVPPPKLSIDRHTVTIPYQVMESFLNNELRLNLFIKMKSKRKVKNCLSHLFNVSEFSDVQIEVGNEVFHAHKCVLAYASPVFKRMMQAGLSETLTNKIVITEFDAEVVETCLRYIYGAFKVAEITVDCASLCRFAHMYDIGLLQRQCERTLAENDMNINSCVDKLQFAVDNNYKYMKYLVLEWMKGNRLNVIKNNKRKFTDFFSSEQVMDFMERISEEQE